MEIFIEGNVPSLKNSKRIVGKRLISSKAVYEYEKQYSFQFYLKNNIKAFKQALEGKEKPYRIGFYFIRATNHKFDYINMMQLPCDLMTLAKWIDDDNMKEVMPIPLGYHVDKKKAGVVIKVLE